MKVFIVHEDIYNAGNPYIYTLVEGISVLHDDVKFGWGLPEFWDESIFTYDIVHFQWPQAFMANDGGRHSISHLENWIKEMKSHGVKVVATCHDLEPHYSQCSEFAKAFAVVYSNCDVIFHLGEYSLHLFEEKYPGIKHLLLPHQLFDTVYPRIPTREEAIKHLGLDYRKKYILCFGMFRAEIERQLVITAAKQLNDRSIVFLAPAFMKVDSRPKYKFIPTRSQLRRWYYRLRCNIVMTGSTWTPIDDETLPYYYAVSDVAFIQRLKILNSGNAILPMLFGTVVVGPDVANVAPLLKKWGYPSFDTENLNSVCPAIKKGMELAGDGYGLKIREKQLAEYSTSAISEMLYQYYKML